MSCPAQEEPSILLFKMYFPIANILIKIQTRFKRPLISLQAVSSIPRVNSFVFVVVVVIGENCEIVKVSVFVIYLPKSCGCCTHRGVGTSLP